MNPERKTTLEGWKEIADYLRVSSRAAQQWEVERGLPVRRMAGARSRVWAEVAEIEAWRERQAIPLQSSRPFKGKWAITGVLAAAVLFAGLGLVALTRRPELANITHDGRQAVATDAAGKVLWTHRFSGVAEIFKDFPFHGGLIEDLDGDGSEEALIVNPSKAMLVGDNGLHCFDAAGRLRWVFNPGKTVRTAQGEFAPPYYVDKMTTFRNSQGEPWRIAVVSIHSVFFPSQVAILDASGRLLREYWHAGHLHGAEVVDLDGDGKLELYTAGVSNGFKNAVILALDPDKLEGAGWEESPEYRFEWMKPGVEIARLLTPRTPLSSRLAQYNVNNPVTIMNGGIAVSSLEHPTVPSLALCMTFGPRLTRPEWGLCDIYRSGFARLKAEGLVTTETLESEARGTSGFVDVSWRAQVEARSRTTERGPAR